MSAHEEGVEGIPVCPRCARANRWCHLGCVAMPGQVYAEGGGWMEPQFAPAVIANGGVVDVEHPFVDVAVQRLVAAARRLADVAPTGERCLLCDGRYCPVDRCAARPGDVHVVGLGWRSARVARGLADEGYQVHWDGPWLAAGRRVPT